MHFNSNLWPFIVCSRSAENDLIAKNVLQEKSSEQGTIL